MNFANSGYSEFTLICNQMLTLIRLSDFENLLTSANGASSKKEVWTNWLLSVRLARIRVLRLLFIGNSSIASHGFVLNHNKFCRTTKAI